MTGLLAAPSEEFSISLRQVAEHLYFHLPNKQSFDKHIEHAKKVMDHLIEEGLVEVDIMGRYRASLNIEGHTLPELIHQAARELI